MTALAVISFAIATYCIYARWTSWWSGMLLGELCRRHDKGLDHKTKQHVSWSFTSPAVHSSPKGDYACSVFLAFGTAVTLQHVTNNASLCSWILTAITHWEHLTSCSAAAAFTSSSSPSLFLEITSCLAAAVGAPRTGMFWLKAATVLLSVVLLIPLLSCLFLIPLLLFQMAFLNP
jgi:hypothetical protein